MSVPTGVRLAIAEGYVGLVCPRSGLAADHGVTLLNSPAVIDSGYRGEILLILINHDRASTFECKRGDRIAQLLVLRCSAAAVVLSESLTESMRGSRGLGSSGSA